MTSNQELLTIIRSHPATRLRLALVNGRLDGLSGKQVAERMGISLATLKRHKAALRRAAAKAQRETPT